MNGLALRAMVGAARWTAGALFLLGLLGLLRGQFDGFVDPEGVAVFGATGSPLTHLLHLLVGLAGVVFGQTIEGTRAYARNVGIGLTAFGLLGIPLIGSSGDIFGRNLGMVLIDLGLGLACLLTWVWVRRTDPGSPAPAEALSPR